jgi:uncharacterized YccA/Bax inhibitor family protein
MSILGVVGLIGLVLGTVYLVIAFICWWKIFSKAGHSGAMGLLILIPVIGELIMLLILAFGKWPALQDLARLRQQLNQPRP